MNQAAFTTGVDLKKRLIIIAAFKTTTKHLDTKIVEKAITKKKKFEKLNN